MQRAGRLPVTACLLALIGFGCGGGDEGGTGVPAPTVTLTAPVNGATVGGTLSVIATATNADRVRFLIDGVFLAEDTSAPYSVPWNTVAAGEGSHTVSVEAEGGGGTATDAVMVTVDNVGVLVDLTPMVSSVPLNGSVTFTATVTGTANTAVTWSVTGGSAFGTITDQGVYTAPGALPNPASAMVTATSVADPSRSASITFALTDPGAGATLGAAVAEAYSGTRAGAALGADGVETTARAVFEASIQNGGTLTVTGTLTQAGPDSDDFTWSATPQDRLVVLFHDGSRLELAVNAFEGDFTDWESFRDFHSNLDVTATSPGAFDLRIQSRSGAPALVSGLTGAAGVTEFHRTITGTLTFNGVVATLNLVNAGQVSADFSGGNVDYTSLETVQGTLSSANASSTVNEEYEYRFLSVSNAVEQWKQSNTSTLMIGGDTYTLQNLFVRGTCSNNQVAEPEFWQAQGSLLRNGETIGVVEFEAFPSAGLPCPGPKPVVRLDSGDRIPL